MTNSKNYYCVILAGGTGSRLWPCSRRNKPKQFHDFFGVGRTLLQQTYDRFAQIVPKDHIYITTFVEYVDLVKEQLPEVKRECILAEPVQLSTAPAVAWATYHIALTDPHANMIVTPSDQHIIHEDRFERQVKKGFEFVGRTPNFLALAVKPTIPETGYGYIQLGDEVIDEDFTHVKSFTEKPDENFAKMFVESGEFVWNTGLFMWNVQTMMKALDGFMPNVTQVLEEHEHITSFEEEMKFVNEYYPSNAYLSIDLVILERNTNVFAVCGDFGWADVGSWTSLYDASPKDTDGNVLIDQSQAMLYDCQHNLIKLPENKVAVLHGLDGYVITEKDNILVICKKDDPSLIRRMLNDAQIKLGNEYV
ncbi:MAG: sugar phosphate nucleotidyltransferase [Bacteroidaceae bacterium]